MTWIPLTNETEPMWHKEEPPKQGWYDCMLNGEEMRLQWWICQMNPKKRHWKDGTGAYRDFEGQVYWIGEPSVSMW